MMDLSILIPARNEEFLQNTIEDILKNIEADTEIIVTLDGQWSPIPLPQYERVNVIYVPEAIGQRAATNIACKLSRAKYVMKLDAHCSFDKGFDRKMIEAFKKCGDDVTMLPVMRNLWAYDWKCYTCGFKVYQDKEPICPPNKRHSEPVKMKKKMLWIGKNNPQSTSYAFTPEPHFIYFGDYTRRPQYIKDKAETGLTESMSIQGSCFMCTRDKYWDLKLCDESLGSWGNQGVEVACKTWLSGGRVLVNHNTWYAHLFRTKEIFGFPWPVSGSEQQKTKGKVKDLIWGGKYEKAIHPVSWLVERFWPIPGSDKMPGWTQEDLDKLKQNGV